MNITHSNRFPWILALAFLMIPARWTFAADGQLPNCYVLSAGVDNYPMQNKLSGDLNDARNATNAFAAQKGKMFHTVYARTLLDGQATHANIMKQMQDFSRLGKKGDFFVVFLSGHGGTYNNNGGWYFLPYDDSPNNNDADLTSGQILNAAEVLMKQGKKVVVVVDACFSGKLGQAAQAILNRHQDPSGGGLILALSSTASQESNALGNYSAFAKAFADGLNGAADLNHDGRITLQELKTYAHNRTYQLLRQAHNNARQDSTILWSKSFSAGSPLALLHAQPHPAPVVAEKFTLWTGQENLANCGQLTFQMYAGGRALMTDIQQTTTGTWQQTGSQITLRFDNGRVVYTGTINQSTFSGTGRNERTSWTFSVQYHG